MYKISKMSSIQRSSDAYKENDFFQVRESNNDIYFIHNFSRQIEKYALTNMSSLIFLPENSQLFDEPD